MNILFQLKRIFCRPNSKEAYLAYFNRLPDKIEVGWRRDGDFIIGEVNADGYKFMTQAKSAKEFIEMVNDALFVVYKIPEEYFNILSPKKFFPSAEQFNMLNNMAVKKYSMSIQKEKIVTA